MKTAMKIFEDIFTKESKVYKKVEGRYFICLKINDPTSDSDVNFLFDKKTGSFKGVSTYEHQQQI